MSVTCYDILQLPSLNKLRLVGGSNGIYREVTWAYITENIDIASSVKGGELLFTTGLAFNDVENELTALIKDAAKHRLAGIIISTTPEHIDKIPDNSCKLADELSLPLFELPWEVKRIDVSREISELILSEKNTHDSTNNFFNLLYAGIFQSKRDLPQLKDCIKKLGIDEGSHFLAMKLTNSLDDDLTNSAEQSLNMAETRLKAVIRLSQAVFKLIKNSFVIIIPTYDKPKEVINFIFDKYRETANDLALDFQLNVSDTAKNAADLFEALRQAEISATVARKMGLTDKIVYYTDVAIYEIYMKQSQNAALYEHCAGIIEKLEVYDKENNGELIKTIITYFENLYNLSQTANALFIHRNSLMYRFEKIEALTGKSLKNPYNLYELVTSCIISKFA